MPPPRLYETAAAADAGESHIVYQSPTLYRFKMYVWGITLKVLVKVPFRIVRSMKFAIQTQKRDGNGPGT